MTQPTHITPNSYSSVASRGHAQYPSRTVVEQDLTELMELFDVTKYQLGRILGTPQASYIYKWMSGANRPSPMYVWRLLKVFMMYCKEQPISLISYIDWDNSVIKWRDGNVTHNDHLSGGGGPLPPSERESRREMAVIPHQPARPDGAHS